MANSHDTPPRIPGAGPAGLWQTWSQARILGLVFFLYLSNLLVQAVVYGLSAGLFVPVLAGGILGVLAPLWLLARDGRLLIPRDLALNRLTWRTSGLTILVALASLAPTSLLAELSVRLQPVDPAWVADFNASLPRNPVDIALAALAVILVAPLVEEIIFRALFQRLVARAWGPLPALVIAALVFGLAHLEPWYVLGLVGVGMMLGWVWLATGSLTACWLAHGVHNAVSLVILLASDGITTETAPVTATDWGVAAVSLAVLVTAAGALWTGRATAGKPI